MKITDLLNEPRDEFLEELQNQPKEYSQNSLQFILADVETNIILTVTPWRQGVFQTKEIVPDSKVFKVRPFMTVPPDIFKKDYSILDEKSPRPKIGQPLQENISKKIQIKKQLAYYTCLGFERLAWYLYLSRSQINMSSEYDSLTYSLILDELNRGKRGSSEQSGFVSRYQEIHDISYDTAFEELQMQIETVRVLIMKTQGLYWKYKRNFEVEPLFSNKKLEQLYKNLESDFYGRFSL